MMKKYLSILAVLSLIFTSQASATDFFVSVGGGRSNSDFNPEFTPDETTQSGNSTVFNAGAGLKLPSQVIFGLGFSSAFSDDFLGTFDHYRIYQEQLYVGYRFNIAKHFRITPQVGLTNWQLKAEQSPVFSNDEDDKMRKYSGNDLYGQINLEFPVGDFVTIATSYSRTHYDFGSSSTVLAGVIFEFD